jgi:hypothetical protein
VSLGDCKAHQQFRGERLGEALARQSASSRHPSIRESCCATLHDVNTPHVGRQYIYRQVPQNVMCGSQVMMGVGFNPRDGNHTTIGVITGLPNEARDIWDACVYLCVCTLGPSQTHTGTWIHTHTHTHRCSLNVPTRLPALWPEGHSSLRSGR